jgi:REP element-mobilizing transposase RayT
MDLNAIYFYTATILHWQLLLKPDKYKQIVIDSMKNLVERKKINVYGFVIMPNHIHILWELLEMNGKEIPHASFMKHTSHQFKQDLDKYHPAVLKRFEVNRLTRKYQFWKRDSLPVKVFTPEIIYQKLHYIHNNPCHKKWMLSPDPVSYEFSSASFYEDGRDKFGFLTHIGERIMP